MSPYAAVVAVTADVFVEAMVATVSAQLGRRRLSPSDLNKVDFDQSMATNLKSALLCRPSSAECRSVALAVSSTSLGVAPGAGVVCVHYDASKAGLEGLSAIMQRGSPNMESR
jgi:NAD(P)-dependent dehydrogenase (short-subunit alcohol dehydrogenase family)